MAKCICILNDGRGAGEFADEFPLRPKCSVYLGAAAGALATAAASSLYIIAIDASVYCAQDGSFGGEMASSLEPRRHFLSDATPQPATIQRKHISYLCTVL